MFKKIKKTIQKDLHKRYEQLEEKFLAFERRLYSHLEERLERLENQFDQINDLLQQQAGLVWRVCGYRLGTFTRAAQSHGRFGGRCARQRARKKFC